MKTTKLTIADVTTCPRTRPAMTEYGVATGMLITLHDSVALAESGALIAIPAGALITKPLSGGYSGRLGEEYDGRKYGNVHVQFRR